MKSLLVLVALAHPAAADPCLHPSALARIDREPEVVRVRVVAGSKVVADGGTTYKVKVIATLRGSTKPGITLEAASGGPCARTLADDAEYVLPLGHDSTVGTGRVDAGTSEPLPTSLALQVAVAKTVRDDVAARAAIVYRAALADKADRASVLAYLAERPEVLDALDAKQKRELQKR